jgi:hypothetical protein
MDAWNKAVLYSPANILSAHGRWIVRYQVGRHFPTLNLNRVLEAEIFQMLSLKRVEILEVIGKE